MKPIWYPLFLFFVLSLAAYVTYRNWGWWREDGKTDQFLLWLPLVISCIVTALVCGLSLLAAHGVASFIGSKSDQEWEQCWRADMVSLRQADGIQGSIAGGVFMIVGRVDSKQIYHYYTKGRDGAFHPDHWTADNFTRIFEEDRKDGTVVQFKERFRHRWLEWIAETDGDYQMDFHIPKGSLRRDFTLE